MSITLTLRDENMTGETLHEWALEFPEETIEVRELIRSRVYQEVQDYNQTSPETYRGLIQPNDSEQTLNGFRLKKKRKIDWKPQFEKAIEAFKENQILILVDQKQVGDLDDLITLTPSTKISFLRLTLLVGG
ncbi:MAG: hypothetical protein COA78_06035 [Blastopirellula sp.]|nr:MAG: hypothetical protein COA78_06035 [Blastopirellula sp.]